MLKAVRGTRDILPEEMKRWNFIEKVARQVFSAYGFSEIATPIFEYTELFARGIGETSDIVSKEMYTFTDRKNRSLTLRPEGTASVMRAYLENNLDSDGNEATKLFYMGPMFRYERPQKGRYRQHTQIGVEAIGSAKSALDAEIILLLIEFLTGLGLEGFELQINNVGCPECRPAYKKHLISHLSSVSDSLCKDCQWRWEKNPMRVFDCKQVDCQEFLNDAPQVTDHLCQKCEQHFSGLQTLLKRVDVPFTVNKRLVRGLDYYTRTAFEVVHGKLGAQKAVAAGGRYDNLIEEIGGKSTPGIGFAMGVDRLSLILEQEQVSIPEQRPLNVYLISLDHDSYNQSFELMYILRKKGFSAQIGYEERSLKNQLKIANRLNARFALISGPDENKKGVLLLKDMGSGSQNEVPLSELIGKLTDILAPQKRER